MIMILFVDEINLYFTRPQSNRLKSNKEYIMCVRVFLWKKKASSPKLHWQLSRDKLRKFFLNG